MSLTFNEDDAFFQLNPVRRDDHPHPPRRGGARLGRLSRPSDTVG